MANNGGFVDYARYQFYLNLMLGLFNTFMLIGGLISMRKKAAKEQIEEQNRRIDGMEKRLENVPANCCSHSKTEERIDGHNNRLQQHKELLNIVENDLKHLPKNADIEKLHEKVNKVSAQVADLKADIRQIAGAMPGITHITEMMNEFLLNNGGK